MAKLSKMIEDLRVMMLEPPWNDYYKLLRMLDSMEHSPELEKLTNDELRALQGFRLTLHRAGTMEPDTMLKHVGAHWLGAAEQAIRKLPIGPHAIACFYRMMQAPTPERVTYGNIT